MRDGATAIVVPPGACRFRARGLDGPPEQREKRVTQGDDVRGDAWTPWTERGEIRGGTKGRRDGAGSGYGRRDATPRPLYADCSQCRSNDSRLSCFSPFTRVAGKLTSIFSTYTHTHAHSLSLSFFLFFFFSRRLCPDTTPVRTHTVIAGTMRHTCAHNRHTCTIASLFARAPFRTCS